MISEKPAESVRLHSSEGRGGCELLATVTGEVQGIGLTTECALWQSSGDVYITGQTDANGVAQAQAGVAPTDRDASVEADGYKTTHLSLSVPDDNGITVDRSIEWRGLLENS